MGSTTFMICREVYSDEPDRLDEVVGEIEIEVAVDYTTPEDPSWDSPGDPGDVSICGAVLSGTNEKVELDDDEVRYIEENLFDRLADAQSSYDDHMYEMDRRNDVCDYPF